jgi:microcystin-dependent protein
VTFALPDLRTMAPNGLTYTICDQGIYPSIR